jgi:hypothetical protein
MSNDQTLRDRLLGADGDLASASLTAPAQATVSGTAAVAQHVRIRLGLIKGEVPWDLDLGVDYWGTVFRKGATDVEISAELERVIGGTPGVSSITELVLTRDPSTRQLSVRYKAKGDLGEIADESVPLLQV